MQEASVCDHRSMWRFLPQQASGTPGHPEAQQGDHRRLRDAAATQIITPEDGRQLRTGVGSTATYKFIAAGEVVLDKTNVACEGGEMKVQGKRHENILDLVMVSFKMVEVEVTELEDRRLRVKDGILPRTCSIEVIDFLPGNPGAEGVTGE